MAGPAGSAPAEIPADPGLPIPRDVHAGGHSYRAAVPSLGINPSLQGGYCGYCGYETLRWDRIKMICYCEFLVNHKNKNLLPGKAAVLKCLLDIHKIFMESDPAYILNDLFITDYCIWIQKVK